ncbi:hypothetical protein BD626DRAFT_502600, partial [Schizophyllum amplum]
MPTVSRPYALTFTRPLSDQDWAHALRVLRYIKAYHYVSENGLPDTMRDIILACPPPSPLLPSLRILSFTFTEALSDESMIDLLASPTVHRLVLKDNATFTADNVDHILQRCPHVKEIHLSSLSPTMPTTILIQAFFDLRTLTRASLDLRLTDPYAMHVVVAALGLNRSLTSLTLYESSDAPPPSWILALRAPGDLKASSALLDGQPVFPALRHLTFHRVLVPFACIFMNMWGGPRKIESFTFKDLRHTIPSGAMQCLIDHIGARCAPTTLKDLRIQLGLSKEWCIRACHIQPLAGHRALQTLRIRATTHIGLGADEYRALECWWPDIAVLI